MKRGCRLEDLRVIQRARISEYQTNAENETKVTHAIHQKGLQIGVNGCGFRVPKANQQIRHQTHRFPAKEKLQEIIAHHQHQHRKGEQRDVAEEALVSRVVLHVANGVDMHGQRHRGDHHHHRGR